VTYRRAIPVEFNHCDPAGIVFYPRYFEMMNSVVENFFREAVGYPFARMMADGVGVPVVRLAIDFRAPSRLGEVLDWTLAVREVGRSSARLGLAARSGDGERLRADLTLAFASLEARALPWPDWLRPRLEASREARDGPA
jgi:4-hydroxybenzoyl-CoA thioesterase